MSLRLPNKQAEALHRAALGSFPDEATLRIWVQFKMGENLNAIKKESGLQAIILDLFYYVDSGNRWESFLQAGIDSNNDRPVFSQACREALESLRRQTAPAAAVRANGPNLLIWNTTPFVDRQTFWIDLEELRTSPRKRILMLKGPPKSGKSYCGELIDHLRRDLWQVARFALIDLKNSQSPDIKPEELCRRILLKLRISGAGEAPPPLPGQKPDRWARDLAAWLGTHIAQIEGEVWIVLDGFDDPSVAEETHVFLAALAEEAGDQDEFRLILLDYERAFGERTERATRRTRIEYLTASDLRLFLDLLDRDYNVSKKPGWQAAQEFVDLYDQHTPGSATQIDALAELLPPIVRSLI
jgi:Effector-associated domain 1